MFYWFYAGALRLNITKMRRGGRGRLTFLDTRVHHTDGRPLYKLGSSDTPNLYWNALLELLQNNCDFKWLLRTYILRKSIIYNIRKECQSRFLRVKITFRLKNLTLYNSQNDFFLFRCQQRWWIFYFTSHIGPFDNSVQ